MSYNWLQFSSEFPNTEQLGFALSEYELILMSLIEIDELT